jgi:hypothetical protein
MKTDKQDTRPFDISIEELGPMLDVAIAKQAEVDAKKAEADAKEARRVQRQDERRAKASEDRQRAREALAESIRGREIIEWMSDESEWPAASTQQPLQAPNIGETDMSSASSSATNEHAPASDAGTNHSAAQTPDPATWPRDPFPALAAVLTSSLPAALTPRARDAAAAAIKLTRTADAVRAARAIVQRVPKAAKAAITQAVATRNRIREDRARTAREATQDRYSTPFVTRLPRLREQDDREHYARVWKWIEETSD